MRYLGVDYSMKYIVFELDGKQYTVQYRDTFIGGTYDISILENGDENNVKIISAYPHLGKRIMDRALVTIVEIELAIKRLLLHRK